MIGCLVKCVSRRAVSEEVLAGTEIPGGGGGRGRLYLSLHCHHQNDSCIKMGSDSASPYSSNVVGFFWTQSRDFVPHGERNIKMSLIAASLK